MFTHFSYILQLFVKHSGLGFRGPRAELWDGKSRLWCIKQTISVQNFWGCSQFVLVSAVTLHTLSFVCRRCVMMDRNGISSADVY